ncbi:Rho GTPase-activating protein isoform 2 [Schistosoma japonicum]|uniref:Rho GTPase-activating protein isoform 2 n=1 Tax=Schistosoma japonicum TaxID=6182 RepID=A0A4Z2D8R3_SCHJA|nr:Rho GTPase-activating protein isoform 2 [Schistosoma japonicum]
MVFKTTEKITISVVGYPGSGTGVRQHVGKSCLINRFMVPYIINENHLSVLSLSDFDSEVISSSHWLYWGENSVDTGSNKLQIRVIEQCDFVDDHSFQPFFERRTYTERCLDHKITVHSRKLSYVCKEQLGHESAFPQVYLEPTTLYIDVFVYVYDMSLCGPPAVQQAAFLEYVITRLSSLKFPVIIATSKHDTNVSAQASILFNNTLHRCKRHCVRNLCIVETSSRLNVNVKTVFQCAAIFGHHKRTSKLRSGPLYCSLKKSEVRKSFTMCFRKSMCSSVPWFQYNTSLCDTNLSSVGSDSPFVQSLTLPNGHNKLRIPERITLPQMIAVTDSSIPVTNPDLLSKRKADQLSTVLFSGACFLQNSSVQDITLPKTSDACDPSVLPTPPPPLSPGPHNIISFEPNGSTTEIYKSIALSPECSDLSHDTRLENPFVEINLRGHVDTSNYIATAIHDLCLLEHYTSKNGHQFRFLLRSNSKNRPSQLPIIPNPFPFYSDPSNRRLNGLTVQPVHMSMTTSQMSAFSAPNRSPLGSSFGGIFNDNHKNNKDLNPIAQRLHDDLTPVNGNLTPFNLYNLSYSNSLENLKANHLDTLAECCIYLFIYKNIDELLACYKQLKRNKLISTTQKTINVLAYLSCSSCNTLERRNAILSGLAISSCCRIPYLIINSESTPVFLDNLLYLAFNYQIGNDETTHTSNPNNSFVDWRCFTNVDYLSFFPEFICSPITVWDELITEGKFQFVGLLTALILSNCHPLSDCTHSHDTNHTFFHLPLTSVREDAQSYYKNTKQNFSCLYAHFVQLDQVESVLYRSPMTYSLRALLIHYSSSSWSDVGIHIENSLKKLCSLFDSSTFGDDNFTPVILMVAFHSGSSQQIPVEVEGIVRGLKLIQHLAQDYGCSLLLPSSEYDAVKVQFGKSPISSCLSTGYESDHINCFQHPFICESTQSRKDAKFSLGFLSVSRSDDVRAELYKRVFEGKFSDLYSSSGTSKTFSDDSVCYKVSVNNNRYCSNIRPSNDCMRKPQLVSNSQNVNSLRSSLLHHHNDVIALPWLPFSATDAFRLKSFRPPPTQSSFSETPGVKNSNSNIIGELYNHKYLSQQSIVS